MQQSIVTREENIERLINTWEQAYLVTQRTERNFKKRLKELESWDTSNGHELERNAKIQALHRLLGK